jgi:hypothetical protein
MTLALASSVRFAGSAAAPQASTTIGQRGLLGVGEKSHAVSAAQSSGVGKPAKRLSASATKALPYLLRQRG